VAGGVANAVHLDNPRSGQSAGAAKQVDAAVGQPALLASVGIIRDHEIAPAERGVDVNLSICRRVVRSVGGLARAEQRLRGDAGPVRALAADELTLDESDMQATGG
jgi:hypothetical protein